MPVEHLHIAGYKSLEELDLRSVEAYTAFAGPNGAGKSNLFDALCFVSAIIRNGSLDAIRQFGGYESIHCFKKRAQGARTFSFKLALKVGEDRWMYHLTLTNMDTSPALSEALQRNGKAVISRNEGQLPVFGEQKIGSDFPKFPQDRSILMFAYDQPIVPWLNNISVFRIDPLGAKEPDASHADNSQLHKLGHNVATMLAKLQNENGFRATIMDWMELIAPGLQTVSTEKQKLTGDMVLTFQESGLTKQFPAHLVSDGTIYVLCILTAVLSRVGEPGMTLIEEPERGINPKAIGELVKLIREKASAEHPIWVTTHSEAVVRASEASELILLNKVDGKTICSYGRDAGSAIQGLPLDKAWLANLFGGGLPW